MTQPGPLVSYYARPASFTTGGVNTSRQQWMRAFAEQGAQVKVVNARGGHTQRLVEHARLEWRSLRHFGRRRQTMLPIGLRREIANANLVYLHEGWTLSNLMAAITCIRARVPYVVMPHGVYNRELVKDLRLLGLRRRLESWVLRRALAVHVFFDSEVDDVHAISPDAQIIISMTGMDLPTQRWSPGGAHHYFAWLGRYDIHHKGIDRLLNAVARLPQSARPRIVMRGPDHRGDRARVESLVHELGLEASIIVGDELSPADARDFLLQSAGFVHVPRWEAFGRTIAESLSLGVPVLLSEDAEIAGTLRESRAALITSSAEQAISEGFGALEEQAATLGQNGRLWAEEHLSWAEAAARVQTQIARLLGADWHRP